MRISALRPWIKSLALLSGLVFPSCASEQETLVIVNATSWPGPEECVVDPGAELLLFGVADANVGGGYIAGVVVLNQQEQRMTNAGVDTSEVHLRDADVSLSIPQAPDLLRRLRDQNPAFVNFNVGLQSLSVAGGGTVGVAVDVITGQAMAALADLMRVEFPDSTLTVEAEIVVHAFRSGNAVGNVGVISSRTFTLPIRVCLGCLLSCADCPDGQCPDPLGTLAGGVCGNGQDFAVTPAACSPQ